MLYLLRHTQPDVMQDTCYGHSDVGLHGDFYAEHLPTVLNKLNDIQSSIIYTSPLTRCKSLAQEVGKRLNTTNIITNDLLKEMNFGQWEMMKWKEIYEQPASKRWFDNYLNEACPDGESFSDMERRAKAFIEMLDATEEDVIAVTHAGFIRAMMVVTGVCPRETVFDLTVDYGDLIEIGNRDKKINE